MSTFEQKKEELKNPDKTNKQTNKQTNSPDAYKSSCHLPLCAMCAVFRQQLRHVLMISFLNSIRHCHLD